MKSHPVTLITLAVLILSPAGPALALQLQGTLWSSSVLYQGDVGSLTLTFFADNAGCGCLGMTSQTYVKAVGVQFDWQVQRGIWSEASVEQNLTSGSIATYTVPVSIPINVSAGSHSFSVLFLDQSNVSHSLYAGTIFVHDSLERVYNQELPHVQALINESTKAGFRSAQALSLLSQAKEALVSAKTLATEGSFREALTQLNSSSVYLAEAHSAENAYGSNGASGILTVALATGVVLVLGLAFVMGRRLRRQPKAS